MHTQQFPDVFFKTFAYHPEPVAAVETAIPAFIGFTETAINAVTADLVQQPFRIHSFLEYVRHFGGPAVQHVVVSLDKLNQPISATPTAVTSCKMYYAVKSYFDNGGITCYIFSLGNYSASSGAHEALYGDEHEYAALKRLGGVDDITLLVCPDLELLEESAYFKVLNTSLKYCATLRDRFLIIDVYQKSLTEPDTIISNFRSKIGRGHLSYGAAYFPALQSTYNYNVRNSGITFVQQGGHFDGIVAGDLMLLVHASELTEVLSRSIKRLSQKNKTARLRLISTSLREVMQLVEDRDLLPAIADATKKVDDELLNNTGQLKQATTEVLMQLMSLFKEKANDALKKRAMHKKIKGNTAEENMKNFRKKVSKSFTLKMYQIINQLYVTVPSSAAVAGVYAYTDRARGVWKAPAGVVLEAVAAPVIALTEADQSMMNANDNSISINAIRAFPARGVLVWGARTLDAGSNEWRYLSARRYFMMVEKSVTKACEAFSFEPNQLATWIKIRILIENFLFTQWRAGALAGVKPEHAFYVKIGLHETMTDEDIAAGRMIVEIGMAVIRPAEFVTLRICIKCMNTD
jgi:uncharacterized protein